MLEEGLTRKQKKFADAILEGKSGIQAALNNYDTVKPAVAGSIAYENLKKPQVIAYLEKNGIGAATRIVKLSKSAKNQNVQLQANKDILDRAGFKPVEKVQNTNLNISLTELFEKSNDKPS